jgi:hypothetical protein
MDEKYAVKGSLPGQGASPSVQRSYKHEIVNVLVRQKDYLRLKELGGPRPDQISLALQHYLKVIESREVLPKMDEADRGLGLVTTFRCSISKDIWDELRNLGGRLDSHTVEAVRLFLL